MPVDLMLTAVASTLRLVHGATTIAVILTAIPAILIMRKIGMALALRLLPTKPQSAELLGVRIWAIDRAPPLFEGDDNLMLRCQ